MQRTLIIGAIAVGIILIGVAVYFIFFAGSAGVTVAPEEGANLPVAGQGTLPSEDDEIPPFSDTINMPVSVSTRLVKISAGPVVPGVAVVNKKTTASSSAEIIVNYIERRSGNIYSYLASTKTNTRISNKTVPGIQSAAWFPNASLTIVRYLSGTDFSTINSYALSASGSSGFFLPQNLSDVAVSDTGILMLSSGVSGSIASLSRADGTRSSEVFTTPLSSLRIAFAGKNQYLAFTKPSSALSGSAFIVGSTGILSRVAGPKNGLVAKASKSGKWVLVSYMSNDSMQMELVDVATGESIALPVATIADKCVWTENDSAIYCGIPIDPSQDFIYPDDWYQGVAHFSDRIWKIDVAGRYAQLVLDFPKETEVSLDAQSLAVDSLNTVLVFVNKNDSSLWSYSL